MSRKQKKLNKQEGNKEIYNSDNPIDSTDRSNEFKGRPGNGSSVLNSNNMPKR